MKDECGACGNTAVNLLNEKEEPCEQPIQFPPRSIVDVKRILNHERFHQLVIGLVLFE